MLRWLCATGLLGLLTTQVGCISALVSDLVKATRVCEVESDPKGAAVSMNGEYLGKTPCSAAYTKTDKYEFVAELRGHRTARSTYDEFPRHILLRLTPVPEPSADCELAALPETRHAVSLAVLDFQCEESNTRQAGAALADYCRQAVQSGRRHILVDRESMRALLTEEDFAATFRCDDTKCLVDYGRKLRAQKIIHGRVNRVGDAQVLTIKMIDVSSVAVDGIRTVRVNGPVEDLLDFVPQVTCELLRDALSREPAESARLSN